jgi:TetR/AcrR family transcriptional regulator, lmrAB and yxaGH operons repressor
MPRPKSDSREKIIESARVLLRRQGYQGTGLARIIEDSGAPRGSTYFLFPGGKEEIAVAAVREATRDAVELIRSARRDSGTAGEWINRMSRFFATQLEASGFTEGLPVTAVTLDSVPRSAALSEVCRDAYAAWIAELAAGLGEYGVPEERARGVAMLLLATLEGTMILARAQRSLEPFELVTRQLVDLLPDGEAARDRRSRAALAGPGEEMGSEVGGGAGSGRPGGDA